MKILVIGSGGREHALVWKILQSSKAEKVYCAPGNGGIASIAECAAINADDLKGLRQFAKKKKIDLTIVGPELPLTMGISDYFQEAGLAVFGPSRAGAALEGSKVFAKQMMNTYQIPTAASESFTDADKAADYITSSQPPFVLKADGLAAGKGVLICESRADAYKGIEMILTEKSFGEAGSTLLVEEFLQGEEVSVLAVTDGVHAVVLPSSQDHKAAYEGDKGPNTGGMGAYAPAPVMTVKLLETIGEKIIRPMLAGLRQEGISYQGVLYAGLMITAGGPKVLEFNCRFGDPETQAVLPLLKTDLVDLALAAVEGRIRDIQLEVERGSSVCIVMASGGYPGDYSKGFPIKGLDQVSDDVIVFHAGTRKKGDTCYTAGGRVLGVTSRGRSIKTALDQAYRAVGSIMFDGAYYRSDIGHRALKREQR